MKPTLPLLCAALLGAVMLTGGCAKTAAPAVAAKSGGSLIPAAASKADAGWLAKAAADYPLKVCVVSGDAFGGTMGPALDYLWREAGQPDRLVRFCCAECPPQFEKEPAKFLAKLAAPAAKTDGSGGPTKTP